MGPNKMHPQVLKELVGKVAKLLPIILRSCGSSLKLPLTGEGKHNTHFENRKKGRRRELRVSQEMHLR